MSADLSYWISLSATSSLHGHKLDQWLQRYSLEELARLKPYRTTPATEMPLKPIFDWLKNKQNHLVHWQDPRYPKLLREIADPPLLLYIGGNPSVLNNTQIAIVGSRQPTPLGSDMASAFSQELTTAGLTITSGLARGIDGVAHRAALEAGGITIAVLANGLSQIYPKQHRNLAEQIQERGAIMSEFPLWTEPRKEYFPQRNRIISGLSRGTLIVEAALKSGSLITARMALEQNREVFAIPGSIYNPLAQGCNHLIQQGAKLVTKAADILEELGMNHTISKAAIGVLPKKNLENQQGVLLECVGFEPTSVDQIVIYSKRPATEVLRELLFLEINGYITKVTGGYIRREKL